MPQKKISPEPPMMTRPKSMPVIIGAAGFDLMRIFFVFFWFFGPALAGIYCTVKTSGVVGTTMAGTVCGAAATVGGAAISAATTSLGAIMADAVGLVGFLALGLWIVMTNARILKAIATAPIQFAGAFAVAEIPFLGALPVFSVILWRLYGAQIRTEKKAHEKWKKETAAARLQTQKPQAAQATQVQAAQQTQFIQQEAADEEQYAAEQQGADTEEKNGRELSETFVPVPIPIQTIAPQRMPAHPVTAPPPQLVAVPNYGEGPPPLPPQAFIMPPPLPRTGSVPPPLPMSGSLPPPLPTSARSMPPPLPTSVSSYSGVQPPPLPRPKVSGMKERATINPDKRSVEQVALRNNAFIVHTIAESGDAQHHNENSNVSGKATYGDDMDIMLAFEPSVSASSVIPGKKAKLWTGDGFILGGGQISEAGSSDQGTIAHGIKRRGRRISSLEEIDDVVGRNSESHQRIYERTGTFGMNELVVNGSEVFGFFQRAGKDENGRYWAFSTDTKKDSEFAKKARKYGTTAFDSNMENYRRRFATAQERGIPLYVMTQDSEVYEYRGVNDDGTVEVGKQLTPEEVAKGRAGLSAEKRKEVGERIIKKGLFQGAKIQKEAEEIVKSLDKEIPEEVRKAA